MDKQYYLTDENGKIVFPGTTTSMIKASDLPAGTHFWAIMDEKLVMMMKDKCGDYYVCGGWECAVREAYFEIIELVPLPAGHENDKLFYR